jgi:NTE family protein
MPVHRIVSADFFAGKRIALVLMGGGAKCAYQVGVWRALWELGIREFSAISGTSGGALNAI